MKHYVDVVVPEHAAKKVNRISCDFCGDTLTGGICEVDVVYIERTKGESYPEGMIATEYSVDMCGRCFESKFIPWAESEGAEISTREIDTY